MTNSVIGEAIMCYDKSMSVSDGFRRDDYVKTKAVVASRKN